MSITRLDMNSGSYDDTATGNLDQAALNTLNGLLKDVYTPGINNTLFFDNKFTRLIEPAAAQLDATGRRIIGAFKTRRSGGVGPMTEGGTFRRSVPIDGIQGWEWLKYANMYVEFTGPALATVIQGEGAYIDLVNDHITDLITAEKLNMERILMGNGTGKLATIDTPVHGASTLTIDGDAFFDSQFIEVGTWIEIRKSDGTLRTTAFGAGTPITTQAAQVIAIARGNKRTGTKCVLTLDRTVDVNTGVGTTSATDKDMICREGAYGIICGTTSGCLEQNGLDNLISDGVTSGETGDSYKYIWGKDRTLAANKCLASIVHNIGGELDEDNLLTLLTEVEYQHQASPNLFVITPRAAVKYFSNSRDDRRFNVVDAMDVSMGFGRQSIQLGDKKVYLTAISSVPVGKGFLINNSDFAFIRPPSMRGYKWLTDNGGSILQQKEQSDTKFASAVAYWQFTCQKPDKQVKVTGISE